MLKIPLFAADDQTEKPRFLLVLEIGQMRQLEIPAVTAQKRRVKTRSYRTTTAVVTKTSTTAKAFAS